MGAERGYRRGVSVRPLSQFYHRLPLQRVDTRRRVGWNPHRTEGVLAPHVECMPTAAIDAELYLSGQLCCTIMRPGVSTSISNGQSRLVCLRIYRASRGDERRFNPPGADHGSQIMAEERRE